MPELTRLHPRDYVQEVKARLRDDAAWEELLAPELMERTRRALMRMVASIDEQKHRAGDGDEKWVRNINRLRALAKSRLDVMPPQSSSKEAQAWRAFSARLARALDEVDPVVLDELKTPYGGLTAREWLAAREEKRK